MARNIFLIDKTQLTQINRSLDTIRARFGDRVTKKIARKAAKPLRKEMRNLTQLYKNNANKRKKNWYYYGKERESYKSGNLKRSVGIFAGKKGIFVGPRYGKRATSSKNDGWYAHIALQPHKVRGGKSTRNHQSLHFIERSRLSKRTEVLDNILNEANKLIKW